MKINPKYAFKRMKDLIRYLYVTYSMPKTINNIGNKRLLICYIKSPFYSVNKPMKHCNVIESRMIAETFISLGYAIDVVDHRCKRKIDYSKYSLIFGFGLSYRNSFNSIKKIKRILYLTGSNPNFSNEKEASRIKDIFNKKGILLKPKRETYWPWVFTAVNSDLVVLTGNAHTKSTYLGLIDNIKTVPIPAVPSKLKPSLSNGKGFLWFGGAGAVHKGLDLILDAINDSKLNISLDVCGPIQSELEFFDLYEKEISKENINFIGMIDPASEEMQKVIEKNSFVILPSCSEGMASSVITCMQYGLIPVITKECGIDIKDFVIEIEELTPEATHRAIEIAINLTNDEILRMKNSAIEYTKNYSSDSFFKSKFSDAIEEFIKNESKFSK
tara:strand:+ start:57 stop:1214 length:1158 start_codon:yes stop_codon:yes gene_type:complete